MGSKSAIGIGNGICFKQVRDKGGGSYIDPLVRDSLVGVWIADQNTNESPTRNIIKNTIKDKGGDLELLNFAYKANSGYNGYPEDFTIWNYNSGLIVSPTKFQNNGDAGKQLIYYHTSIRKEDVLEFKVKITLDEQSKIKYWYIKEDGTRTSITYSKSGTYTIPTSYFSKYTGENTWFGFEQLSGGCIIEQPPLYAGALVTDGKDDIIVSQKTMQEMLDGSNEMTVVSMIHQIAPVDKVNNLSYNNYFRNSSSSFIRNNVKNIGKTGIYGYKYATSNTSTVTNILGDKNDYSNTVTNEKPLTNEKPFTSRFFVEGWALDNETIAEVSQVAWYWTFIANRVLTSDEINQVIAYYNLDKYVKPDIYYDVKKQGLTNDTPDTDWYLKDFSGNGRDMQLYNYSKTSESGINEEGGLQSDGVTDYGQFVEDLGLKDYTVVVDRAYVEAKASQVPIISNTVDDSVNTPFLMEHLDINKILAPHSFSRYTTLSELNINRFISYQSTYKYNGIDIDKGTSTNTGSGLTIGKIGGVNGQYANIALWSLLLFPYTLSEFLLERQLKRYKLGTLYPDMVEFRPIAKSNIPYKQIDYFIKRSDAYVRLNPGDYFSSSEDIIVRVTPIRDWQFDVVSSIKVNGKDEVISVNSSYAQTNSIHIDKSPQKIDITIDEYIRYEDIVQPYPAIINLKQDGKTITWGDKLKVGSELVFVNHTNLLPELYTSGGEVFYNGKILYSNTHITAEKSMVFVNPHGYKKDNEPNCIADPQRLHIPNSSYKILGYIPDISGHGNHLKINNSAYAEMSGANGYKYDWNNWRISKSGITSTITDSSIHITSLKEQYNKNQALFESSTVANTGDKSNFKVNITGLTSNIKCTFNNAGAIIKELVNGVNEISVDLVAGWYGFMITALDNSVIGDCDITIQQIGQYEGSFCFDGVDDFITIPTLSHGAKQVLMKVNWQEANRIIYDQRNSNNNAFAFAIYISDEGECAAYNARNNGETYIDGVLNSTIMASQLKGITHNITITNNNATNAVTISPIIGCSYYATLYGKMALFTFMFFDEISSDDEIKELNDIIGIEGGYVESPDYYWDAYGKSNNLDEDIDLKELGLNNARISQ